MAYWQGTGRSNVFKVKDLDKFFEDMGSLDIELHVVDEETNEVKIFSSGDGNFPANYFDDDLGDYVDVDIQDIIQKHLTDDSCCVLIEVGNENFRYLTGWSCAITSKQMEFINLDQIYQVAAKMAGGSLKVGLAAY